MYINSITVKRHLQLSVLGTGRLCIRGKVGYQESEHEIIVNEIWSLKESVYIWKKARVLNFLQEN